MTLISIRLVVPPFVVAVITEHFTAVTGCVVIENPAVPRVTTSRFVVTPVTEEGMSHIIEFTAKTGETAVKELDAESGEGDWWTNQFVQKAG